MIGDGRPHDVADFQPKRTQWPDVQLATASPFPSTCAVAPMNFRTMWHAHISSARRIPNQSEGGVGGDTYRVEKMIPGSFNVEIDYAQRRVIEQFVHHAEAKDFERFSCSAGIVAASQ